MGPLCVSLDPPEPLPSPDGKPQQTSAYPEGRLVIDQLGTSKLAPLVVVNNGVRQINPALASNHIGVIKDTHGKTSQLSAADIEALSMYLKSLQK
ncbi:MAG: hypothetical protein DMG04_26950 [Acidobacteria bacterium]|nr:MAG: hypothetical protein DMG04_26950 [Acidobacteriota bacterium]PYQ87452.1 MAG: hypothetical protein DMG03_05560 [Acidobacteriota bacterium]PYQ89535.1 MAG: hypothetical protein DMG02_15500 [Acidobacteriota bacterium]PYR05757.1 MAG: hypothetical protein DMF99_27575 [Acidobacteriota bacterium]